MATKLGGSRELSWARWVLLPLGFAVACGGLSTSPSVPSKDSAAAASRAEGCKVDGECKDGRVCREGQCVVAISDDDLMKLEQGDLGLASLRAAETAGWCEVASAIGRRCREDAQCPGNSLCFRGACRVPESMPKAERPEGYRPSCTTNDDCKQGRSCTNGACVPGPIGERLRIKVAELSDMATVVAFSTELASAEGQRDPGEVLGDWLLLAHGVAKACEAPIEDTKLAGVARNGQASIPEERIEQALSSTDCRTLGLVHRLNLWPYRKRFVMEVDSGNFSEAEITRRTWLAAVRTLSASCGKRLGHRDQIAAEATIEKLDSIVGLDDPMLIELRTALLGAIKRDDANAVAKYAEAVAQREKTIDARHAAAYEARMAELQKKLAAAKAQGKPRPVAAASKPRETSTAEDINAAVDSANKVLDTTNKTVETIDRVGSLFGW